VKKRRKTSYKY